MKIMLSWGKINGRVKYRNYSNNSPSKRTLHWCIAFDVATSTQNPTNSFTEVTERVSGAPDLTVLERIVSATGAYETTVDWSDSSPIPYGLCGVIATFKDANPGGFDRKKSSSFFVF